ncbi:matrix protein [Paramyxoviridae sp. 1]|uniref:Matrix protein n=1 Tax=Jeilongvirus sp. TaxID=2686070 RepID=A0A8F7CGL3_9MONO|nr:M protein [Jeilongvirus sp.]QXU63481.1 M protein [Jeilongvirus sp.]WKD80572.1 matrix protein [Paramyxoviridae sp. 1]
MEGKADFLPSSWHDGGTLYAIDAEADDQGRLVPKYRVVNPGWNSRKDSGYMYLLIYGIIEEKEMRDKKNRGFKAFGAFPLGVGKSNADPQDLLDAVLQLDITVRRTAGSGEKLVMGTTNISPLLSPWKDILVNGAIFQAIKVCNNVDMIMVDRPQKLRPIFLTITLLTDAGCYKIPKTILDFRASGAISFNLLVTLSVGADFTPSGVKGMVDEDGEKVTTFMVHIGNFVRKGNKQYSVDYCRQKVDKMDLRFSLGAVGGLSFHVKLAGKVSKALRAQLGYKSTICYSLMDTNPYLNRVMWKAECSIRKVTAVFQPSVPKEFRIYDDVLIDHTGKILRP